MTPEELKGLLFLVIGCPIIFLLVWMMKADYPNDPGGCL